MKPIDEKSEKLAGAHLANRLRPKTFVVAALIFGIAGTSALWLLLIAGLAALCALLIAAFHSVPQFHRIQLGKGVSRTPERALGQ
jgi:uncharacterized protein (DUF58 family)